MGKLSNIKAVMGDARSRTILIITMVIIVVGIGFGYFGLKRDTSSQTSGASVGGVTPRIQSQVGTGSPSREYTKTLQQENIQRAQEAARTGGSSIPVISRAGLIGSGDFLTDGTAQAANEECSPEALAKARAAGVTAAELRCKGCTAEQMRAAGYTAGELLEAGFSAKDLLDAGFTPAELRDAGFSAEELLRAGVSPADLLAAGFSPAELAAAGVSAEDLAAAGVGSDALKAAGIVGGSKANMPNDCSVEALKKARANGISAGELKKMGCSAAAMKAAGYTAKELKDAGFSAKELRDAGFSAKELKDAGFTAGELKAAGFSAKDLKDAGFSAKELRDAGFSAEDLLAAGFSPAELKAAGFSDGDLVRAGVSPAAVYGSQTAQANLSNLSAGCSVEELRQARVQGVSAAELKQRGCPAAALKAAGYTAKELKDAGFSAKELKDAGFSAKELKDAGFSAAELAAAGVSPAELLAAGFSPDELAAAGFTPQQIAQAAGVTTTTGRPSASIPSLSTGDQADLTALEALQQRQQLQLSQQQREELLSQLQSAMATQASELFSSWSPPPQQQFVQGTPDQDKAAQLAAQQAAAAQQASEESQPPVIKAGSVMFAVLDTGINSDEPSPIMATIVDGKLKGAKILGDFSRVDKKVVLKFNVMSVPDLPNSISINAVAIDPNTARTAMSTDVNNHYLLRYGTLFASSFLEGLGEAISDSGSTSIFGLVPVVTKKDLNTTETVMSALGNVGKRGGQELKRNVNRSPTVKVRSGYGIGVLFMADVSIADKGQTAAQLNAKQEKEQEAQQAQTLAAETKASAQQAAGVPNVVAVVPSPYQTFQEYRENR